MIVNRPWFRRGLVLAVLGIHAGLLAWIAAAWSPTFDEPHHLTAGVRLWQTGHCDLDRGNPPLFRAVAALPVMLAKPAVDWHRYPSTLQCADDFLAANGPRSLWLITLGRWALIPLSLVGAYVCYRWAHEWYGYGAGMTALMLWCFSPNILANGNLITGDLTATSLGIAAFYIFWRWLDAPSWSRAGWAGIFWGLAELSKFVWLILYPLWPLLWLLWRTERKKGISPILVESHTNRTTSPSKIGLIPFFFFREAAQFVVMGLLSVWVINLGYGFEGSLHYFQPSAAVDLRDTTAIDGVHVAKTGFSSLMRALPIPLPKNYVDGLGEVQDRSDNNRPTYLRGEYRRGGWWYFYPYAILVKEPVGMLLLFLLATVLAVASHKYRTDWRREALLSLSLAAVLCFLSSLSIKQWLRYALPVFPFLFIWAGRTGRTWENRQQGLGVLAAGCLLWSVTSSLAIYPYSLSYFNELARGPLHGYWHLAESNIDWGQDLLYLRKWLDAHPEATPFHLAYFGKVDPRLAGIEFSLPPTDGPRPGWHAISINMLRVLDMLCHDGHGGKQHANAKTYGYFFDLQPVAMAGYTIYIYHVTLDEANRIRAENHLPLLRPGQSADETKKDGAPPVLKWLKDMLVRPGQKKTP